MDTIETKDTAETFFMENVSIVLCPNYGTINENTQCFRGVVSPVRL